MLRTTACFRRLLPLLAAALGALGAPALAAEPKVVVTIKPVHSIVAAVMAGAGAPDLLIDGAQSPHTFALRPSDVRRLNAADVVVRVSPQLETALERPLALLDKRTLIVTLDRLPGLVLHRLRSGEGYDAHDHAHGARAGHPGHDGHGARPTRAATQGRTVPAADEGGLDPHLWLDPANAVPIAAAIAEALAGRAPAEAERYRRNAAGLAARIGALDGRLRQDLAPVAGRPYIVFHDAYQYLEKRYGLAGAGSVTVSPEVPPSAQRLSRIRARLAKAQIVCVFAEPQFPPRTIETIIEGTSVRKGVLDPLGAATAAGPEHYFNMVEALARDLASCLTAAS